MTKRLSDFEGQEVLSSSVRITNAGDGLSKAMNVEPSELHQGDTVTIALECEVHKLRFDPLKDTDGLQRVHILRAGRATIIESSTVATALDEQQRRIEAAVGIARLDFEGEAKKLEHDAGEHTELVEGCPACDEEVEAERAEVEADYDAAAGS